MVRVPVAAAITYGVGKMAAKWVEDGMPACPNFEEYRDRLVQIYEHNKETVVTLANTPLRDKPLGNESTDFLGDVNISGSDYLGGAKNFASSFISSDVLSNMGAVKDVALGVFSILGATVKDTLEKSGNDELLDNVRHAASGVGSLLKILAAEAFSLTAAVVGTSASKANMYTQVAYEKAESVSQSLNASLQTAVEPVVEKATTVVQGVKETVEPTLQKIEEKASEVAAKAIDQAQDAVQEIREKAEVVKETAIDLAEQTKDKFKN